MGEILVGVALIVLASKVGPALAARIRADAGPGSGRDQRRIEARLTELEERVTAVTGETGERLAELEERVDFAERVLQQHRERGLPPNR
jgi:tetrahydromethanopterin S-methyltransferase subunit G